jgi:glyoxylase-like metal-dependent hydrolase (beta-lactamase superfamily II)
LKEYTGAPTYAFGPHGAVEDPDDDPEPEPAEDAKKDTEVESKESVDTDFVPTIATPDGFVISGPGWTFDAVYTPGHTSNHTCFALREEQALFSGDHVMGWSTTVVSPPDGDMRAYCASMEKVIGRSDKIIWPTHGNPVTDPQPFLRALLAHRLEREAQVLEQLRMGPATIEAMVKVLYKDVREELHKAAGRSVLSHLRKLVADGAVTVGGDGRPTSKAEYRLA